jgi:histidyl-tRNA synthetase
MRAIGLKQVKARIGNIGILRSLLPFGPADQALVLHSLDKRNFEMLDRELRRLGRPELAEPLRKSVGLAGNASILAEAKKVLAGAAPEGFEYLRSLGDLLTAYGIPPTDYDFDMGVVRGLDYYTGMVFEIDSPNLGSEKQVGGGGAYSLAEIFGGERMPQTGFALGLDRLVMAAEAEGTIGPERGLDAYVIPVGDGMRERAVKVVTRLRVAGLRADIDLVGRGPTKNLDFANTVGAKTAVLVGEKEARAGSVALRVMKTGTQSVVALDGLAEAIRAA